MKRDESMECDFTCAVCGAVETRDIAHMSIETVVSLTARYYCIKHKPVITFDDMTALERGGLS